MRQFVILILTLFFVSSYGQTKPIIFKTTDFINGSFYRDVYDTIHMKNEKIDIYFLNAIFLEPRHLPPNLIDKKYKNETIKIWNDNEHRLWINTYTYDSLSRITDFTYSSCTICSSMAYEYKVIYNSAGQVEKIYNIGVMKDKYKFYYNNKGNIQRLEKYNFDDLNLRISLVD